MITQQSQLTTLFMSPQEFYRKHSLSQEAMADLLAVNPRTVQRWLSGERNPSRSAERAIALVDALLQE